MFFGDGVAALAGQSIGSRVQLATASACLHTEWLTHAVLSEIRALPKRDSVLPFRAFLHEASLP